jgi:allantoicase
MADEWETARHLSRPALMITDPITGLAQTDLNDWAILKMACVVGDVERLELDTKFLKGNYPESLQIEYCCQPTMSDAAVCVAPGAEAGEGFTAIGWKPLLTRTKMGPDQIDVFQSSQLGGGDGSVGNVTHLRVSIYPDGGVSRVRLFGVAVAAIKSEGSSPDGDGIGEISSKL